MDDKTKLELCRSAQIIMGCRAEYYKKTCGKSDVSAGLYAAYTNAADMLGYALNGDAECLRQFSDYKDEEPASPRPSTPCDDPEVSCPFNAQYSEDCRYHCGLGVDEDDPYVKHYDDCYDGCGGEDCACCEIYQSHRDDALAIPEPCNDDFDIYGRSRVPYEPIEDEDDE